MDRAAAIFEHALQDLEIRMGVPRAKLAPADLLALARASERAADPFRGVNADAAGRPVRVCDGVYFWRLTIGASVWMDDMDAHFGGAGDERYHLCLIHALVHAREPDAFGDPADEASVMRAVKRTCRGICATPAEVNAAMEEALGIRTRRAATPEDTMRSATDWRSICVRLEAQTGISAHDWIWSHSAGYALACYNDLNAFARAFAGERSERMLDELDAASEALQRLKVAIMRRVREEVPNG